LRKILFRADAAPHIGIGDLASLISLSKYFEKEGWGSHFTIRNYPAGIKLAEKRELKNLTIIDPKVSVKEEINILNALHEKNRFDAIFFEITERAFMEYKGITTEPILACVSFDGSMWEDIDLVVSWAPDAKELFDIAKYPNTKFLLGYEYVVLPIEFCEDTRIKNRTYNEKPKKLLIAMGGADENNITQKVVDVLVNNRMNIELNIIVGSGYTEMHALQESLKSYLGKHEIRQNISNMLDEYLDCDVAIGAGGLTSSELVASNTPALLIACYEHQIERCEFFDKNGWAQYLGFMEFDEKELLSFIGNPIKPSVQNIFNTKAIVDELEKISKY